MERIGKRIRELRLEKGVTQASLARTLGITQDSISLWETDKRVPDTQYVVGMAKYFEVTSDYLLCLSDDYGILHNTTKQK